MKMISVDLNENNENNDYSPVFAGRKMITEGVEHCNRNSISGKGDNLPPKITPLYLSPTNKDKTI